VPWSTSEETTLEAHDPVTADGESLTIELLPRSVTTLVGTLEGAERDASGNATPSTSPSDAAVRGPDAGSTRDAG
jgi:hypothetical protein